METLVFLMFGVPLLIRLVWIDHAIQTSIGVRARPAPEGMRLTVFGMLFDQYISLPIFFAVMAVVLFLSPEKHGAKIVAISAIALYPLCYTLLLIFIPRINWIHNLLYKQI